jgi:hypothetical protein
MESSAGLHYIPRWTEVAVTGAIIGSGFALFGLAVKYLPIFPAEELLPVREEAEVAVGGNVVGEAVPEHAGD